MNVSHEWSQHLNTLPNKHTLTIATDLLGHTYITTVTDQDHIVLTKYTADNLLVWRKELPDNYTPSSISIATDPSRHVYLSGMSGDQLKLTCYNALGNVVWQTADPIKDSTAVRKTYTEPKMTGDICVIVEIGTNNLVCHAYNSSGEKQDTHQWSLNGGDTIWAITTDKTEHLYLCGKSSKGGDQHTSSLSDAWLAKYTLEGEEVWREYWGASTWDIASCVATDGQGAVYLAGTTEGQLGDDLAQGGADAWLAKYSNTGELLWIDQFGSLATDQLNQLLCDCAGNIYISGQTAGQMGDFPTQEGIDVWLAKYRPNQDLVWLHQWHHNPFNISAGLSCDGLGNLFWVGHSSLTTDDESSAWFNKFRDDPKTIAELRQTIEDQTVSQIMNFQHQLDALRNML